MSTALANPQVTVNSVSVSIKPGTLDYTEGFGEQIVRAASTGGGGVEQIFADDITDNFSTVKFALDPTLKNMSLARSWKSRPGKIVITVTGKDESGTFSRTFNNASLTNDYNVPLGPTTQIDLEFKSKPAT